jgi:hypothetical protein
MKTGYWRDEMRNEIDNISASDSEDSNDWVRVVVNLIKKKEH